MLAPVKTKPTNTFLDGFNIFKFFLGWIGIVKTEVATTAKMLCQPKVKTDGFGMTDMEIPVRFRRKTGHD